jgi:prolyl-tRNA synthetase
MICISAQHPDAEKLEEQHHNAQDAYTEFFACFELAAL